MLSRQVHHGGLTRTPSDGIISYVVGFLAMVPFFSTVLFTGPVAQLLQGADIAPIIGLVVSAGLYLLLMRRRDLSIEFATVATRPQSTARAHELPLGATVAGFTASG
jgi:hypothetical protein